MICFEEKLICLKINQRRKQNNICGTKSTGSPLKFEPLSFEMVVNEKVE